MTKELEVIDLGGPWLWLQTASGTWHLFGCGLLRRARVVEQVVTGLDFMDVLKPKYKDWGGPFKVLPSVCLTCKFKVVGNRHWDRRFGWIESDL